MRMMTRDHWQQWLPKLGTIQAAVNLFSITSSCHTGHSQCAVTVSSDTTDTQTLVQQCNGIVSKMHIESLTPTEALLNKNLRRFLSPHCSGNQAANVVLTRRQ